MTRVYDPEDTNTLQSTEDWELTGLTRFRAYGLRFFLAGEPAFWHASDVPPIPAGVICHTLVLDTDSRRTSYALLSTEQGEIDREAFTETVIWYGVEQMISQMRASIDEDIETDGGRGVRLPSPGEYAVLKNQHGIA